MGNEKWEMRKWNANAQVGRSRVARLSYATRNSVKEDSGHVEHGSPSG